MAAAGHKIIDHTWTHANLTELAPAAVTDQMTRASDAIEEATRATPTMFRAPYGAWSPAVLTRCRQLGLAPPDWSVDPGPDRGRARLRPAPAARRGIHLPHGVAVAMTVALTRLPGRHGL